MKLELILNCLADHILKFVDITEVNASATSAGNMGCIAISTCIHDDWHDKRLLRCATFRRLNITLDRPLKVLGLSCPIQGRSIETHETSLVHLDRRSC